MAPANFDPAYSDGKSKARSTVDGWEHSSRDEAAGNHALRGNHQGGRTEMDHPSHEPIIPSELERIARIGSWSLTPAGLMRWSDKMYRVFDVSPETFVPDVGSLRKLTTRTDGGFIGGSPSARRRFAVSPAWRGSKA